MPVYCVTYDLNSPRQNYNTVHDYLKTFAYCKHLDSFWLINSSKTAAEIRNHLEKLVDDNDVVFVAKLHKNWAALNYKCAD